MRCLRLRERLLRALDRGGSPDGDCAAFEVSHIWVYQVRERVKQTGERGTFQIGGHRRSRVMEAEQMLCSWIAQNGASRIQIENARCRC